MEANTDINDSLRPDKISAVNQVVEVPQSGNEEVQLNIAPSSEPTRSLQDETVCSSERDMNHTDERREDGSSDAYDKFGDDGKQSHTFLGDTVCDFDDRIDEPETLFAPDGSVVLTDASNLQGETDVDISNSREFLSAGDTINKLHNVTELSSMSASISTDKTFTSSALSASSIDEDSLGTINDTDSTKSASVMLQNKLKARVRTPSESAVSESVLSEKICKNKERSKSETDVIGEETQNVNNDINCVSNHTQLGLPRASLEPLPQSGGSGDTAEGNNGECPNPDELHPTPDTEEEVTASEPFTSFVDDSRLRANLSTVKEQSGNVQEQVLSLLLQNPEDSRSRKQLKKLLRSGSWAPTSTVRRVAWLKLCKYMHKLEKAHVYLQMEKELFGDCEEDDVPAPTWPQQPAHEEPVLTEFYLKPEGKKAAHKIVAVIGQLSPDITYCPGLLPLVDLFLHYWDIPDCFSCVLTLLQSRGPIYLLQTRVAFEASKYVMKDLAKKYTKSAYVSLVRSCSNVESVFDNWLGWIYSDLPFNYVVVITDSFLMEGIKVLYRVVLAIVMLFTKYSSTHDLHSSSSLAVARSISHFCQNPPVSPGKLLKVAFRIRGFSRKRIQKLQNRHEAVVVSGCVSVRPDIPHVASSHSMGDLSMGVSNAVSMAHPSTKLMGFHDTGSNMLTVDQFVTLWSWLPARYAIYHPHMLFNSADQGTTLMTLYAHIEMDPCTVIVIKTVDGEVFGSFCADAWVERRTHCRPVRFFGTGETFVFTLVPERVKYEWVGKPDPHVPLSANMFQAGDNASLMIGGGNGCAIQLDTLMERCRTETCDTFNNPPLCPSMDFVPAAVEVFGLQ